MALLADMGGPIFLIMGGAVLIAGVLVLLAITFGGFWIVRRMRAKNPSDRPPGEDEG